MSRSSEKLAEIIQREINDFLMREVEFPFDCLVTLTQVEVTSDLKQAFLQLSILPITKTSNILKLVNRYVGRARHFLSKKLTLHQCPTLKFVVDDSALKNRKIEKALEELQRGD